MVTRRSKTGIRRFDCDLIRANDLQNVGKSALMLHWWPPQGTNLLHGSCPLILGRCRRAGSKMLDSVLRALQTNFAELSGWWVSIDNTYRAAGCLLLSFSLM